MRRDIKISKDDFEETLTRLRIEYKDALVSVGRRKGFDKLAESWKLRT